MQHNLAEVIAYYYLDFKRLVDQGEIAESVFALMTDRLLLQHGYKQIYGSQILNGELYPIASPANVDERRRAVGLGPLKDYLMDYFEIEYEPPVIEK